MKKKVLCLVLAIALLISAVPVALSVMGEQSPTPVYITVDYNGIYDGNYHTGAIAAKDTAAVISYSDDGGATYTLSEAPKYKDAGTYTVYARVVASDGTADCTYQVEIAPRDVLLTSADESKTYDGTQLKGSSGSVSGFEDFIEGEFYMFNMTGSQTNVGSSENSFNVVLVPGAKETNYNITKTYGTLTVNKRKVTVTSGSAIKSLTQVMGTGPAVNAAITVGGEGFVAGELKEGYPKAVNSQTAVGETDNTVEYKWNDGYSIENYDITEDCGKLKVVTDGELAAVATGYEGEYDGLAHGGTITISDIGTIIVYDVDGSGIVITENPTFTDAGNHTVRAVVTKGALSCTVEYTVNISKRKATIMSGSAVKTYDGTNLTNSSCIVNGFVDGESASVTATGKQKNVGSSENNFTYYLIGGAKSDNYEVSEIPGTLTVNKCRVAVTSGSAVDTYSGVAVSGAVTNADISVSGAGFIDGELEIGYPCCGGTQEEVGESENTILYRWVDGFSADNYDITENLGKLAVVADEAYRKSFEPEIIAGANQVINISQANSAVFKSEAPFDEFVKVVVDGKDIASKYYTVTEGSTIVTLNKEFLSTLTAGKHKISIVSANGQANTEFTVIADTAATSPKTGDSGTAALWVALASAALLGVFAVKGKKVFTK